MYSCSGDVKSNYSWLNHLDMQHGLQILLGVQLLVWICSLYIIFVHNYKRKKQTFVKVIWVFISLAEINLVVNFYYLTPLEHG